MADRFVIKNCGRRVPLSGAGGDKYAIVDCADYSSIISRRGTWYAWKGVRGNLYAHTACRPTVSMHRLISGAPKGMSVDHVNGNGLDNRRENLRVCTHSENMKNQGPRNGRKYKGCYYNPKRLGRLKWSASIRANGKVEFLGRFATEIEAASAYDVASEKLHGVFGRKNFAGGAPSQTIFK